MPADVVTLGQIAARLPVLEVACNRCDRRGRLRTDRLLAEHGPDLPMPKLRRIIAADGDDRQAAAWRVRRAGEPDTRSG
jgi:hypothetical protein